MFSFLQKEVTWSSSHAINWFSPFIDDYLKLMPVLPQSILIKIFTPNFFHWLSSLFTTLFQDWNTRSCKIAKNGYFFLNFFADYFLYIFREGQIFHVVLDKESKLQRVSKLVLANLYWEVNTFICIPLFTF